jgi:hypothetical protein
MINAIPTTRFLPEFAPSSEAGEQVIGALHFGLNSLIKRIFSFSIALAVRR